MYKRQYMIQNSEKPIVITGAQKPINMDVTDAKTNLLDSFIYASDDASQDVTIVFDGKVIVGTRAKKERAKRDVYKRHILHRRGISICFEIRRYLVRGNGRKCKKTV